MAKYNFKRVIVLGDRGMLGRYILKYFQNLRKYTVIGYNRSHFDFGQHPETVHRYLNSVIEKDDLVINCIGMINKRPCQKAEEEVQFWRVNSVLPRLIALVVENKKGWFAHITTDCVINGKDDWRYSYGDIHTSIDVYGLSKSLGDCGLLNFSRTSIIRCSIIGEEENDRSLVEWVRRQPEDSTIRGFVRHYWNGITCLELAKQLANWNEVWSGEHILGSEDVNKYELVCYIAKYYNPAVKIIPFDETEEIDRRLDVCTEFKIPSLSQQLQEMYNYDVLNRRSSTKIN